MGKHTILYSPTVSHFEEIYELYLKGESIRTIAKKLGFTYSAVRYRLTSKGYKPRTHTKKYKVNETFFDNIDTEEKAYFLGFLFADGNVSKTLDSFSISLHYKDAFILEEFKKFLEYTGNIYKRNSKNMCKLKICDKNLIQSLIKLGCVPKKSLVLKFPELPIDMYTHFIRGYFDGDGHIRKRYYTSFELLGTYDFLLRCAQIFNLNGIFTDKLPKKYGNIYSLHISKKEHIIGLYKYLYKDASYFLPRKHDVFKNHHNNYINN